MIDFHCSNKNLHILLDCDDVLLDWIGGFRAYVHAAEGVIPTAPAPSSWDMSEWLGLTSERTVELIQEFNSHHWFGHLEARADALRCVAALKNMGHRLTVLTSCSDDPAIVGRRRRNLERAFGNVFEAIICLPLGQSKAPWLGILEKGIWVEDNYKNGLAGNAAGHKTFMLRRSHNRADEQRDHRSITWIDDLQPIVSLLS